MRISHPVEKVQFRKNYLKSILKKNVLKLDPENVEAIVRMPTPRISCNFDRFWGCSVIMVNLWRTCTSWELRYIHCYERTIGMNGQNSATKFLIKRRKIQSWICSYILRQLWKFCWQPMRITRALMLLYPIVTRMVKEKKSLYVTHRGHWRLLKEIVATSRKRHWQSSYSWRNFTEWFMVGNLLSRCTISRW